MDPQQTLNPSTPPPADLTLYRQLLACLEEEEEALKAAREEEILALAGKKEAILRELAARCLASSAIPEGPGELRDMKRRVTAQASRNRALITAALEVIRDLWGLLVPPGVGLYQAGGQLQGGQGGALLRRQV